MSTNIVIMQDTEGNLYETVDWMREVLIGAGLTDEYGRITKVKHELQVQIQKTI